MISRRTAAWVGLVLVLLSALGTWELRAAVSGSGGGPRAAGGRGIGAVATASLATGLALIHTRFLRPTEPPQLVAAALRGAVASLGDPYSAYLSPAALRALRSSASGRYSGIGIAVVANAAGQPVVDRVVPGSPAATTPYVRAPAGAVPGLRPGDRILSVGGRSVVGMDQGALRALITGADGSEVAVAVLRPGAARRAGAVGGASSAGAGPAGGPGAEAAPLVFRLTRRSIQVASVGWRMLPEGIGYIAIGSFNEQTPAQMGAAVAAIRARGAKGAVIDLRDDPGGLVGAAQQVARYLLPAGVVAYIQPRYGPRQALRVPDPTPIGLPYAVLVDGYTASAAELLAGAIQDDRAAPLVGEPTFGKGSVQQLFPLPGGAALKLTVAHYLTPNGRDLDGAGIHPDDVVAFPGETPSRVGHPATDPQLAAALALLRRRQAA